MLAAGPLGKQDIAVFRRRLSTRSTMSGTV